LRLELEFGVSAHEDRARHKLAQILAHDGRAVMRHQDSRVGPKRACERAALLRLDHQEIGVPELVMLVPERHGLAHGGPEMKDRHDRHARDGERHHRRRMVVAHRHHVGPRRKDAAVNDALGKELDLWWGDRL
jgi:hypothetical protein